MQEYFLQIKYTIWKIRLPIQSTNIMMEMEDSSSKTFNCLDKKKNINIKHQIIYQLLDMDSR